MFYILFIEIRLFDLVNYNNYFLFGINDIDLELNVKEGLWRDKSFNFW